MKLTLIILALAGAASANPIQIAGSGTFELDLHDSISVWTGSFGGSDGVNGVAFTFSGFGPGAGTPVAGGIGGNMSDGNSPSGALIDGQHFSTGFFSFSLGGGTGSITGYDASLHPVITQAIAGYVVVTSETCTGPVPGDQDCSGTFAVTTPEPATWLLCGLGLAGLCWRRMANPIAK